MAPPKTALVTGAAGGIGRATVQHLVAAGYRVIGSDLGPQPDGLPAHHWVQVDLGATVNDPETAQAVFSQVRHALSGAGLSALVNNAAVQVLGGADDLAVDDWRRTLDTNLLAPFIWTQALLPELERAQGCVVNISSIHARQTKRGFVAYATSKAALSGMTRALAVDLGGRVRVNAVEPAAIATDMLRAGFEGKPEQWARLEGCHPQGRIGSPDEVAQTVLALIEGVGRFMHGACLALDGGISGRLHDPD